MTTAALRKRLEALEQVIGAGQQTGPEHIFIVSFEDPRKQRECVAVSCREVGRVERLPNESAKELHARAAAMNIKPGVAIWFEHYDDEESEYIA